MDLLEGLRASKLAEAGALSRHRFLPTRAGLVELVVLFALLLAVDRWIMSPGDFAKLQPHPFWLPVILLSLQYGTADGVLAAATAILLGIALGWPSQGIGEDYYHYIVRVWAVPIGWIVTSIVIGEVRARQRSQMTELQTALDTTREQAAEITSHCYKLEDKIQRLEREFATADVFSLDSMAAALQALHHGDTPAWLSSLARAHRGLLGAGSLTVVLRSERAFVPVAQVSVTSDGAEASPNVGKTSDPAAVVTLLDKVILSGRSLSAQRAEDAAVLDGIAAMAAPISVMLMANPNEAHGLDFQGFQPSGRMSGVLLLDAIAPERLTIDTENRLDLLAREIAQALTARRADDLIAAVDARHHIEIPDPERGVAEAPETPARRIGLFPRFGRA